MEHQSVDSQKGEIEFRRQMVEQQVEGTISSDCFLDVAENDKLLAARMADTARDIAPLKTAGVTLSPYIEVGAERCQRSLVMEDEFAASGAAVDISFEALRSCEHYREVYGKSKVPLRVCCDANYLPFQTDSVPFVFCYETLHHFPDPTPVVKEIHRVLSPGGCFFFAQEPYKRVLHLGLYSRRVTHADMISKPTRARRLLDMFFAKEVYAELEYGIIENQQISVRSWQRALSPFARQDITLYSLKGVKAPLHLRDGVLRHIWAYLFGGGISGACYKAGSMPDRHRPVNELLTCPECRSAGGESRLVPDDKSLLCGECGKRFPLVDNVAMLLTYESLRALYPSLYEETIAESTA